MVKIVFLIVGSIVAAANCRADPVLDNERVTVWDTTDSLPAAQHDFVAISFSHLGTAVFGRKGDDAK